MKVQKTMETNLPNALPIAVYILNYAETNEYKITNIVLQKILYYVQGYFLKIFNKPAFSDEIVNWGFGATVREVYYEFNGFVGMPISITDTLKKQTLDRLRLKEEEKNLIGLVVDRCMKYKPYQLVDKVLYEAPYKETGLGKTIPKALMTDCFHSSDPLKLMTCQNIVL